jgi:FixJ family two-component response regulator
VANRDSIDGPGKVLPAGRAAMAGEPTVYVVDDEADVLRALSRLLRSEGLPVRTFDDPCAFVAFLQPQHPGCIVLDLSMPELDGLAVQRVLAEKACSQPVILLSGNADGAASASALRQGAVDSLSKPVDGDVFLRAVRAALAADGDSRAAGVPGRPP